MQVHERQVGPPPRLHVFIAVQPHQQEIPLLPRTLCRGSCISRSKFSSARSSSEALKRLCSRWAPVAPDNQNHFARPVRCTTFCHVPQPVFPYKYMLAVLLLQPMRETHPTETSAGILQAP